MSARVLTGFLVFSLPVAAAGSEAASSSLSSSHLVFEETVSVKDEGAFSEMILGDKESFFIKSSFGAKFLEADKSQDFRKDGRWSIQAVSPQRGYLPGITLDFGVSGIDPHTGEHFGESGNQSTALRVKGSTDLFSYGGSYKSVGSSFTSRQDKRRGQGKDSSKFWIEKSLGDFSIQPYVQTSEDNNTVRADKTATKKELKGVELGYTAMDWPYIGTFVGFSEGTQVKQQKSSSHSSGGKIQSVSGSLSLAYTGWKANLMVDNTTPVSDELQMQQPHSLWSGLDLSLYSEDGSLSFSPGVSFSDDSYEHYGVNTVTQSAWFTLDYSPEGSDFKFSAYAYYDQAENEDWYYDTRYLYTEIGIEGPADFTGIDNSRFSFSFSYDQYVDGFYSDSNTGGLSVLFSIRILSIDNLLFRPAGIDHPRLRR